MTFRIINEIVTRYNKNRPPTIDEIIEKGIPNDSIKIKKE